MVDFQIVNEQVGAILTQMTIFQYGLAPTLAPTGWCGFSEDPILSTQRIPRGRDPVGAILKKMAISFKENALRVADFL